VIAGEGEYRGAYGGAAPDANLVSVKVAGWDGATDVSTVIAGLQWIAENRSRFGIRVLNMSFGTDSRQSYRLDPLNRAVENLWDSGVLVVAAAGNNGPDGGTVSKPGDDPFVLTVGATDTRGTATPTDDLVAPFSSRGPTQDGIVKPDLVAPGITIVSDRAPGSTIDRFRATARVGEDYFKGSGSSQAAAIVSGVAARMFTADPGLSPDAAKHALMRSADRSLAGADGAGAGIVNATAALRAVTGRDSGGGPSGGGATRSNGSGSIDASRGSGRVYADLDGDGRPEPLEGEIDALGAEWDEATVWSRWRPLAAQFPGYDYWTWTGPTWGGVTWDAKYWGASSWQEAGWTAKYWGAKYWGTGEWN